MIQEPPTRPALSPRSLPPCTTPTADWNTLPGADTTSDSNYDRGCSMLRNGRTFCPPARSLARLARLRRALVKSYLAPIDAAACIRLPRVFGGSAGTKRRVDGGGRVLKVGGGRATLSRA